MKKDIILAGVGGQGILSIATIIGYAAIESGLNLKQAEVHGMSQRGGDVQSHLRISDKEINSDLIPQGGADVILSVEPMEALRYKPYLSSEGWFITNSTPFVNIPDYPDMEVIISEIDKFKNKVLLDGDKIAKELGSARSMNVVILGAASSFLDIPYEKLEEGIKFIFARKGEAVINANLNAMKAGREMAEKSK
ncbi:MAG: indolepyruvate oxidoreductase subunit beta [Candidatus Tenebribacter davisii]|nr:indolepyruvate oxidoreductase subunit beta [Candidatus Tenebribacter davisii]